MAVIKMNNVIIRFCVGVLADLFIYMQAFSNSSKAISLGYLTSLLCRTPVYAATARTETVSLISPKFTLSQRSLTALSYKTGTLKAYTLHEVTHHPSHHTRIVRRRFSGLQAVTPGLAPASFSGMF